MSEIVENGEKTSNNSELRKRVIKRIKIYILIGFAVAIVVSIFCVYLIGFSGAADFFLGFAICFPIMGLTIGAIVAATLVWMEYFRLKWSDNEQ